MLRKIGRANVVQEFCAQILRKNCPREFAQGFWAQNLGTTFLRKSCFKVFVQNDREKLLCNIFAQEF